MATIEFCNQNFKRQCSICEQEFGQDIAVRLSCDRKTFYHFYCFQNWVNRSFTSPFDRKLVDPSLPILEQAISAQELYCALIGNRAPDLEPRPLGPSLEPTLGPSLEPNFGPSLEPAPLGSNPEPSPIGPCLEGISRLSLERFSHIEKFSREQERLMTVADYVSRVASLVLGSYSFIRAAKL